MLGAGADLRRAAEAVDDDRIRLIEIRAIAELSLPVSSDASRRLIRQEQAGVCPAGRDRGDRERAGLGELLRLTNLDRRVARRDDDRSLLRANEDRRRREQDGERRRVKRGPEDREFHRAPAEFADVDFSRKLALWNRRADDEVRGHSSGGLH